MTGPSPRVESVHGRPSPPRPIPTGLVLSLPWPDPAAEGPSLRALALDHSCRIPEPAALDAARPLGRRGGVLSGSLAG